MRVYHHHLIRVKRVVTFSWEIIKGCSCCTPIFGGVLLFEFVFQCCMCVCRILFHACSVLFHLLILSFRLWRRHGRISSLSFECWCSVRCLSQWHPYLTNSRSMWWVTRTVLCLHTDVLRWAGRRAALCPRYAVFGCVLFFVLLLLIILFMFCLYFFVCFVCMYYCVLAHGFFFFHMTQLVTGLKAFHMQENYNFVTTTNLQILLKQIPAYVFCFFLWHVTTHHFKGAKWVVTIPWERNEGGIAAAPLSM